MTSKVAKPIYTVGYTEDFHGKKKRTKEYVLEELLLPSKIDAVVDIRLWPYNRFDQNWQWSAKVLSRFLPENGVEYYSMREFGNLNRNLEYGGQDLILIKDMEEGLAKLKGILSKHKAVCLLCWCRHNDACSQTLVPGDSLNEWKIAASYHICHRMVVVKGLRKRYPGSISHVVHLDGEESYDATLRPAKMKTLYTIGYSKEPGNGNKWTNEEVVNDFLIPNKIDAVVDVRLRPHARVKNWPWGKTHLAEYLPDNGIAYYHLKELGNEDFAGEGTAIFKLEEGLTKLKDILSKHKTVCLMCMCHHYECCHRKAIVGELGKSHPDLISNVVNLAEAGN